MDTLAPQFGFIIGGRGNHRTVDSIIRALFCVALTHLAPVVDLNGCRTPEEAKSLQACSGARARPLFHRNSKWVGWVNLGLAHTVRA